MVGKNIIIWGCILKHICALSHLYSFQHKGEYLMINLEAITVTI